jgi:hypothetical protein
MKEKRKRMELKKMHVELIEKISDLEYHPNRLEPDECAVVRTALMKYFNEPMEPKVEVVITDEWGRKRVQELIPEHTHVIDDMCEMDEYYVRERVRNIRRVKKNPGSQEGE